MQSSAVLAVNQEQFEDPLAYLPCSTMVEYAKGGTIYNHDDAPTGLYLVIYGAALILVVRWAPEGLTGIAARLRVRMAGGARGARAHA